MSDKFSFNQSFFLRFESPGKRHGKSAPIRRDMPAAGYASEMVTRITA
jgi:hypothetical protein